MDLNTAIDYTASFDNTYVIVWFADHRLVGSVSAQAVDNEMAWYAKVAGDTIELGPFEKFVDAQNALVNRAISG